MARTTNLTEASKYTVPLFLQPEHQLSNNHTAANPAPDHQSSNELPHSHFSMSTISQTISPPSTSHSNTTTSKSRTTHNKHHRRHQAERSRHATHSSRSRRRPSPAQLISILQTHLFRKRRLLLILGPVFLILLIIFIPLVLTKTLLMSSPASIVFFILLISVFLMLIHTLIRWMMLKGELRMQEARARRKREREGGVVERGWDISWPRPMNTNMSRANGGRGMESKEGEWDADVERGEGAYGGLSAEPEYIERDSQGWFRGPQVADANGDARQEGVRLPPPIYGNYRDSIVSQTRHFVDLLTRMPASQRQLSHTPSCSARRLPHV
jgi:hypothetical protein